MSEYEGKWPKCLNPQKSCSSYKNGICLAEYDEGCPEHKARGKEYCDCGKKGCNPQIEINLPDTIKVGGFDYAVICSKEHDVELERSNLYGVAYHDGENREIDIKTTLSPQNFNNTVIHELIHVADVVNNSCFRLTEAQVEGIANGLHQVMEQLGIRFVMPKVKP